MQFGVKPIFQHMSNGSCDEQQVTILNTGDILSGALDCYIVFTCNGGTDGKMLNSLATALVDVVSRVSDILVTKEISITYDTIAPRSPMGYGRVFLVVAGVIIMVKGVYSFLVTVGEAGSFRLGIATIVMAFLIYKFIQSRREYEKQYDAIPSQRLLAFQSQSNPVNPFRRLVPRVSTSWPIPATWRGNLHARWPTLETFPRDSLSTVRKNLGVFDVHINDLISSLSATDDGIIDLQPFFFKFTLTTATDLLFGEPVGALGDHIQNTFGNNFDYASMICVLKLRLADFHWLYGTEKSKTSCTVVKQYVDRFVTQALKYKGKNGQESASERYPFILDLYKDLKDPALVRDQLVNVFITGRYTTACLMSWAVLPVIPGGQEVTLAHIAKIPFLRCVINETHRLYPQLPVNARIALKTTLLPSGSGPDGKSPVLIPKGTGCAWSTYHMHRMASLYGHNANEFVPERWEDIDMERKVGFGFLPFHGGPKVCLGKDFALSEALYAIVKIVQTFSNLRLLPQIEKEKTGQEKQSLTIVVTSAEGPE
ncbi:hypothetical protein G7Y89_g3854 [Cudoniella acicularis]|uniref:Cytochrome P450 n=1 Tax=Cudoniella acicularis TaxID=354080 RepID=A0A8H4RQJ7_9HELO|nr:hypothetical protein G7Y89_g3854 [Cudoniella acicularis]